MVDKWLTTPEVCKLTGLCRHTIYSYIKKGILEAKRITNFQKATWYIDYFSIPTFLRKGSEK